MKCSMKMMVGKAMGIACLGLATVTGQASAAEGVDEGLLFYAPMNGDAKAAVAAGDPAPYKARDLNFVEGKFGQAVEIKDKAQLYYAGGDNFNFGSGTVSMWVKRNKPWKADMFILFKGWADDWNKNSFYLATTDYAQLRVWIWNDEKDQTTVRTPNGISYQADQWYHLATTFEDGGVRVYIDGEEISYGISSDATLEMPLAQLKRFTIGSDYTPDVVLDGLIDELRIYDRPLSAEDVKALYEYQPAE